MQNSLFVHLAGLCEVSGQELLLETELSGL